MKYWVGPIDDGAANPLVQRQVAPGQELEGFSEVPARTVEVMGKHGLDGVSLLLQIKVPRCGTGIDKPDIVITVR